MNLSSAKSVAKSLVKGSLFMGTRFVSRIKLASQPTKGRPFPSKGSGDSQSVEAKAATFPVSTRSSFGVAEAVSQPGVLPTLPFEMLQTGPVTVDAYQGAAWDAAGKLNWELSYQPGTINPDRHLIFTQPIVFSGVETVEEAYLAMGAFAPKNFYHFLYTVVARVQAGVEAGLHQDLPFVVPQLASQRLLRVLTEELFPEVNFKVVPKGRLVSVGKAHSTVHPQYQSVTSAWGAELLRKALADTLSPVQSGSKKVLVASRQTGEYRKLLNEEAVANALESFGEVQVVQLDKLTLAQQAEHFFSCNVCIGMHGANLSLVAMMKPGSTLVEILPEHVANGKHNEPVFQCYRGLANVTGVNYHAVGASSIATSGQPAFNWDGQVKEEAIDFLASVTESALAEQP